MKPETTIRVATRLGIVSTVAVWTLAYLGAMLLTAPVLLVAIYLLSIFDPEGSSAVGRYAALMVCIGVGIFSLRDLKHRIAAYWSR